MKTKTAIYYSAMFLSLEEVCQALESGVMSEEAQKECDILVKCANLIVDEIASDWLPLKNKEKITVNAGEFDMKNLQKPVIDVFRITDKEGRRGRFRQFFDKLFCDDGEYEIEYSYAPGELTLESDLPFPLSTPSVRVIAYGIACEYNIISGLTAEASVWENKFIDALKSATSKKREFTVKRRRWA